MSAHHCMHCKEAGWGKELALLVPGIAEADRYVSLAGMTGLEPANTRAKI